MQYVSGDPWIAEKENDAVIDFSVAVSIHSQTLLVISTVMILNIYLYEVVL